MALIVATVGCDRVTKHFATVNLSGSPHRSFLADTVRLQYAENSGAFLSLGAGLPEWGRRTLFVAGTGFFLLVLGVAVLRRHFPGRLLAGLCLIWAGGVSNLIDRIARGTVVDFLNVGVGRLRTGIFNVADLAITIGVAVVLIREAGFFRRRK